MAKVSSKVKNIALITTGGTIGGAFDPSRQAVRATNNGERLLRGLQEFSRSKECEISEIASISLANVVSLPPLLSEEMTPHDWQVIAKEVAQKVNSGVDGVVITHGTDTMAYTSAALSFMLRNLSVPVVFTGSHLPPDHKATDAFSNLYDSVITAVSELSGVFVVFDGFIHRGTKVRKMTFLPLEDFDSAAEEHKYDEHNVIAPKLCFISVNTGESGVGTSPLGSVKGGKIVILDEQVPRRTTFQKVRLDPKLDLRVQKLSVYPGFYPSIGIGSLIEGGIKGIVLELYNSGTACARQDKYLGYSLIDSIEEAVKKRGIFVFATSQQIGRVEMSAYDSSRKLAEAGAIPLRDMTTESAVVKLMWVLGHTQKRHEVEDLMLNPIADELYPQE